MKLNALNYVRQAFHAQTLGFVYESEEEMFEAPLPNDMEQVIDKWRLYVKGRIE